MLSRSVVIYFTLRPFDLFTTLTYVLMETFILVFVIVLFFVNFPTIALNYPLLFAFTLKNKKEQ